MKEGHIVMVIGKGGAFFKHGDIGRIDSIGVKDAIVNFNGFDNPEVEASGRWFVMYKSLISLTELGYTYDKVMEELR